MATKKPLCNYGGKIKELQSGDSVGGGGGASNFTDLGDVPASYSGEGLKLVRVNSGETALEFTDPPSSGLTQQQIEGLI